ncbi:hypothetical protein Tco_1364543 [Tanacetum coccineum]
MGKGLLGPKGKIYGGKGGRGGSIMGIGGGDVGGVEKISTTRSKFMANGEDCLDGCDGACGGEVKGSGFDLGVVNSLLGVIPGDVMRERGRDTIGVDGGAV